jgi:hypothetical protein
MTASQLEKLCRKYALVQRHGEDSHPEVDEQRRYVRRRDLEDGMVKIEAVLHPEEAELVWTMLDHAASRLAREAAAVDKAAGGTVRQVSAASAGTDAESPSAEPDSAESPAAEPCLPLQAPPRGSGIPPDLLRAAPACCAIARRQPGGHSIAPTHWSNSPRDTSAVTGRIARRSR